MDWDTISFVFSSEMRARILVKLRQGEHTPTQISRELGAPVSHVSKILRELSDKGLVSCLTPDRRKARFYSITERGNCILEELRKLPARGGK